MKSNFVYDLVVLMLGATLSQSCMKENDLSAGKSVDKVVDLKIPANFDWTTSMDVLCDFTAQHASLVYVSLSETAEPFATFVVSADADNVYLDIPLSVKELYVKYETATGVSVPVKVPVKGKTLSYVVPEDSKVYVPQSSARSRIATKAQDLPLICYPANGWGTLMFEDLWPAPGDYDFNDLVVNYKIQLYPQNKNMIEGMLIGLRIKAVGGSIPYNLYLQMKGVKGGEIEAVELIEGKNTVDEASMTHLNPGDNVKDPALFLFENVKKSSVVTEGSFFNTDKNFIIPEDKLVNVSFYVVFRNSIKNEDVTPSSFDFFIGDESQRVKKEIHMGGYEPVLWGENNYTVIKNGSGYTNKAEKYYYSNTGLVWVIQIPASIPHVCEGTDFTKAYPNFRKWAESGGTEDINWYENTEGNRVSEFLIP